jgi:hypothetical protein
MTARAPSTHAAPARARLLRHRDVRLLLAGQAVSELGSQVGAIALPLVAVLGLGASPLQIGMLTAAGTISFAVLALPAGVWVDRLPRRPLLVGADLARGAALVTVPVAAAAGRLTLAQLAVVALAVGPARVLFDVAHPSYLPTLVDRDELVRGNAYLESSRSATQLGGPGLGGWPRRPSGCCSRPARRRAARRPGRDPGRPAPGRRPAQLGPGDGDRAVRALHTADRPGGGAWPCCRSASPSRPSARPSTTSARPVSDRRCARRSCSAG